jgi:hypothetical protein
MTCFNSAYRVNVSLHHSVAPAPPVDTCAGVSEKAKSNFQLEEDVWGGGPTGTLATAGCVAMRLESTGTVCAAS